MDHTELGGVRDCDSSSSLLAFAALTWKTSDLLSAEHMSHVACLLHEFVLGLVVGKKKQTKILLDSTLQVA